MTRDKNRAVSVFTRPVGVFGACQTEPDQQLHEDIARIILL